MDDHYSGKRYGVIHYADAVGYWYAVVDRQADPTRNIVRASRLPISAHGYARALNAGKLAPPPSLAPKPSA